MVSEWLVFTFRHLKASISCKTSGRSGLDDLRLRFRQGSGLKSKSEEYQVNALIYIMGDKADDILCSFELSEDEKKVYDTVRSKFDSYFEPQRNVIFERAKFNQRRQQQGESVETFITELYCLADR